MSLEKVLIFHKTFPATGLELLRNKVEIDVLSHLDHMPQSLPKIKDSIGGYDAIIWNTKHKLTGEILDLAGPQLKAVSTMSSGTDHIDIPAVKQRGILLGNTPQVLDNAVADITVGLLIAAARRFKEGVRELEAGEWKYGVQWMVGQDIAGSTVGIVGFGGIGQAVLRRLRGFDVARFLYSGRTDKPQAKELGAERVPIDQLLKESDFVILACPLTTETKHLINADSLKTMKKTAVVINIARGEIIDQDALYTALVERQIFAAGLDVVTPEPMSGDHPLVSLPNCYLLPFCTNIGKSDSKNVAGLTWLTVQDAALDIVPHLGSATVDTRNKMATISAQNVLLALEGKPMLFPC